MNPGNITALPWNEGHIPANAIGLAEAFAIAMVRLIPENDDLTRALVDAGDATQRISDRIFREVATALGGHPSIVTTELFSNDFTQGLSASAERQAALELENIAGDTLNDAKWFVELTMIDGFRSGLLNLHYRLEDNDGAPISENWETLPKRGWPDNPSKINKILSLVGFFSNRIHYGNKRAPDPGFTKGYSPALFCERREFDNWLDTVQNQPRYVRLPFNPTPRDELITSVMRGDLTAEQAEAEASTLGVGPLTKRPVDAEHDPMSADAWSLPMAVAWISWRDVGYTRRLMTSYREQYWDWGPEEHHMVPKKHSTETETWVGRQLKAMPKSSIGELFLQETHEESLLAEGALPKCRQNMNVDAARLELWRKLFAGGIEADGIDMSTRQSVLIPKHEWRLLDHAVDHIGDFLCLEEQFNRPRYRNVAVDRLRLITLWPERPSVDETIKPNKFSPSVARELYISRISTWPPSDSGPSGTADISYMQEKLPGIPRDHVRQLRRDLAPSEWRQPGRRKSRGQ